MYCCGANVYLEETIHFKANTYQSVMKCRSSYKLENVNPHQ